MAIAGAKAYVEREQIAGETLIAVACGANMNFGLLFAPWQGRFWDYQLRDGMRIPLSGEVAWQLPDGWLLPYWRGRITNIAYELAR